MFLKQNTLRKIFYTTAIIFTFATPSFSSTALAETVDNCYGLLNISDVSTQTTCGNCCTTNNLDCSTVSCIRRLSQMRNESSVYQAQREENATEAAANEALVDTTIANTRANDTTGYYNMQDAADAATIQNVTNATTNASSNTVTGSGSTTSNTANDSLLGSGFENRGLSNFSGTATNPNSSSRGAGYNESGIGTINALLYNVKDFFKYAASGMAVLWLLLAAFQLVTAADDEGVKKGKANLTWSIIALAVIFAIDILVIAFFEGGSAATPGSSLFVIENGRVTVAETSFVQSIAAYFQTEAKTIFNYLKVITGAIAILFIFIAGVHIISAGGNEEGIEKEKKYLMHALTAFITLIVLDSLIFNFIYPANTSSGLTTPECVEFLKSGDLTSAPASCRSAIILGQTATTQIMGAVNFFSSLIGGIAVFFIVYSAIRIISSFGDEEVVTKHKKTLLWAGGGLGVILLADTLIRSFIFVVDSSSGTASINVNQGLQLLAGFTNFLATFIGVFSVISILIAGIFWVSNFGNEEVAGKAKKIIFGAVIGIIISISAYSVVNTLASGNNSDANTTSVQINI